MGATVKRLAEWALCAGGVPRVARVRHARDVLVLAYHDIVPEGAGGPGAPAGDASLHLPRRAFAEQLDLLRRMADVVPLERVLDAPPRRGRPRVAITFDDAYHGALTAGLAELEARGLPATVFVAPAFLGGRDFWWDALAGPEGLAPELRERALHELAGRDALVREWAAARGKAPAETAPHMRATSETRLAAATRRGITLASHTWSHPYLPALPPAELQVELARPLAWLRERFEGVLPWLSYPYGGVSQEVARCARETGYRAALRVEGGWIRRAPAPDPHVLPRLNIPAGVSLRGFQLRVAGLRG